MSNGRRSGNAYALIANALADPRRYAILKHIANQRAPISYATLQRAHAIGAATMSYHLKRLAEAQLIDLKKDGKRTTILLRPETLERHLREIEDDLGLR